MMRGVVAKKGTSEAPQFRSSTENKGISYGRRGATISAERILFFSAGPSVDISSDYYHTKRVSRYEINESTRTIKTNVGQCDLIRDTRYLSIGDLRPASCETFSTERKGGKSVGQLRCHADCVDSVRVKLYLSLRRFHVTCGKATSSAESLAPSFRFGTFAHAKRRLAANLVPRLIGLGGVERPPSGLVIVRRVPRA